MSALPFSLGCHSTGTKLSTPPSSSLLVSNLNPTTEASTTTKFSSHENKTTLPVLLQPNEGHNLFKRREAMGLGFCLGLVDFVSPSQHTATAAAAVEAAACELTLAPSGLAYCDKVVGYGPEAVKGQLIKAHYVGKLENGTVFDSSYNRGKPLTFRVGVGEVIKGWDQGILGGDGVPPMLAGGKRMLKLPPGLGYGIRGAGCRGGSCVIPPDSVLLFDVEFIGKG